MAGCAGKPQQASSDPFWLEISQIPGTVGTMSFLEDGRGVLVSHQLVKEKDGMSNETSFYFYHPKDSLMKKLYSTKDFTSNTQAELSYDGTRVFYQCNSGVVVLAQDPSGAFIPIQIDENRAYLPADSSEEQPAVIRFNLSSRLSPDQSLLAEIDEEGELLVKEAGQGVILHQYENIITLSSQAVPMLRWSQDSRYLLAPTGEIGFMIIDLENGQERTWLGERDFSPPDDWMEFLYLGFIKGSEDIALAYSCENGVVIQVLLAGDDYATERVLYMEKDASILDANAAGFLYYTHESSSPQYYLNCWDYAENSVEELASYPMPVTAAWASEDGSRYATNCYDTASLCNQVEIFPY